MNISKVVGNDDISNKFWKCVGKHNIIWLTKLINEILRYIKMSDMRIEKEHYEIVRKSYWA